MYNSFKIKFDEFTSVLTVYVGDFSELSQFAANKFNILLEKDAASSSIDGLFVNIDNDYGISGQFLLAVRDSQKKSNVRVGVIAHEALHAVRGILKARGIPFDGDNEELIAYLQEYIIEKTLDFYDKISKNEEKSN